ncbi:hypothetical protein [Serpentinicella alkaliphila]|uniref:Uncharacterized protein n=1 Tax=Serpentinicella alkaliphila TaxID=1734049 RepID=A0A4R2TZY1_9FIRM|nr:hypothetical protein [Serpentinicella alkaliphila]QUH25272.1 hypothetical protein HZR23_05500 [Serpentinicella alkaliphila]TCQ07085.1 hypothetical protein EDD79_100281 [Serpentinicella alkaliphila]
MQDKKPLTVGEFKQMMEGLILQLQNNGTQANIFTEVTLDRETKDNNESFLA